MPDHARVQTGGYLGMVTLGVGYSAFELIDLDVYYGWVPEPVGGVDIHSVALRVGSHVKGVCLGAETRWIYLTGGVGAVMTFGERFFLFSPAPFPSDYYSATMTRWLLSIGTEVAFRLRGASPLVSHGVFIELTAMDEYMLAWLKNAGTLSLWEPWSLSIGYKLRI